MDIGYIITAGSILISGLVAYFTVIKEHENRIVKVETRLDSVESAIKELKEQISEMRKENQANHNELTRDIKALLSAKN
jgi:chromosome segregation ATPase